jgi:hypothetical protein
MSIANVETVSYQDATLFVFNEGDSVLATFPEKASKKGFDYSYHVIKGLKNPFGEGISIDPVKETKEWLDSFGK